MQKTNKIFKKLFIMIVIAGFFVTVNSASNARTYSLGQAFFLGDIVGAAGAGWKMLNYPDQIQASGDFSAATGKPGAVIFIKSFGENFCLGTSLNTFDRRTGGSILASDNFYKAATNFTPNPDLWPRFPNYPQLHVGFKIGKHKFGIDAFFETQNYNKNKVDSKDSTSSQTLDQKTSVHNVGGSVNALLVFGNLGVSPWITYGVPFLKGFSNDVGITRVGSSTTETVEDLDFSMEDTDMLLTGGVCFDYTFNNGSWAIIGSWYRIETFQFERNVFKSSNTRVDGVNTATSDTTYNEYSSHYDNRFTDYFIAFTPKIFDDFTIGFEYQGGFNVKESKYEDESFPDTTRTSIYNDVIVNFERPFTIDRKLVDKIIPRGGLRWSIGRAKEKVDNHAGVVEEIVTPLSTVNQELEGMRMFLGLGFVKKRVTVDFAIRVLQWSDLGLIGGAPPAFLTFTLDLHKDSM